jgi:predicted nucleic-acid-binding protein
MIGLDTNILVRYLTQDDPEQTKKVNLEIAALTAQGISFYITSIVMCELVWVLESAYEYSREEIATALDKILQTQQFRFENKTLMLSALTDYRAGKGDFSDYLAGQTGKQAGCTETLTFDQGLKNSVLFRIM